MMDFVIALLYSAALKAAEHGHLTNYDVDWRGLYWGGAWRYWELS